MDEELLNRLKTLEIEDFIWIVFIGLILLSFYANNIERDFLITGNECQKQRYRRLTIFIFCIAFLSYFYYAKDSYKELKKIKPTDSEKKKRNANLSYIASIFIATAGIILIYIAITDTELEIELALN